MQNEAAQQVTKALKEANNVLVTVKNGPSVDELSAAIGLTLLLNRMNKHAITVFSGTVPSTLEFLQPEMAIDTTTDSLRDFIIALDKSKADKLRYKVEDNVVRIFITPYKTSLSEKDLEFSQGDFNVDVVVALGVVAKEDFDQAITAHGRILHDATVLTVTHRNAFGQIGAVNWHDDLASSVSEMMASIVDGLGPNLLDGQIATAFMTGIVAETDRFKNEFTTPQVLTLSAKLMSAGANQQLIAEKLDEPELGQPMNILGHSDSAKNDDGALEIEHDDEEIQNIHIDDHGNLQVPDEQENELPPIEDASQSEQEEKTDAREYLSPQEAPKMFGEEDAGNETPHSFFANDTNDPNQTYAVGSPAPTERKVIQPLAVADEPDADLEQRQPELPQLDPPAVVDVTSREDALAPAPAILEQIEPDNPAISTASSASTEQNDTEAPLDQANESEPKQTLSDLEKELASPHTETEPQDPTNEQFFGTSRPVAVSDQAPVSVMPKEAPEPVVGEAPQAENTEADTEEEDNLQPPPTVIDPTAPPDVPPPLVPQPSQPQFYEADGKSSNPFVNPS